MAKGVRSRVRSRPMGLVDVAHLALVREAASRA
jgi:hypothetical protein